MTIFVIPNGSGGFSSAATTAITTAFQNWMNFPNANQSISGGVVQTVSSLPSNPPKPYAVFQRGSPTCGGSACAQFTALGAGNTTDTATVTISPDLPDSGFLPMMAHEIGHTYGLRDCPNCSGTAMNNNVTDSSPTAPTDCDSAAVYKNTSGTYGSTKTSCNCHCVSAGCCLPSCCSSAVVSTAKSSVAKKDISDFTVVASGITPNDRCTPIIIDVTGQGFKLTDTKNGVMFDIFANKTKTRIPWIDGVSNAWLVLDRNRNGVIDDATELFGNLSPQPESRDRNGYLALAEFDKPANGGNGDGVIDGKDAIFKDLRLWFDRNHDGVSQPTELVPLPDVGIVAIDLHYTTESLVDANGNEFRYKGMIDDSRGSHVARWSYDVILVNNQ